MAISPTISPLQAADMLEEAEAAYRHCKRVLPPSWVDEMRRARAASSAMGAIIQAHKTRSPGGWQLGILQEHYMVCFHKGDNAAIV